MAKVRLKPGTLVRFDLTARIGLTGTVVDIQPDWGASLDYCRERNISPVDIGRTVLGDQLTYKVFLDEKTGELWIDDETGA